MQRRKAGSPVATIYHIVARETWAAAQAAGRYAPDSLAEEGFIHAGYRAQLPDVANILYHGEPGLVVLCIDPARVAPEIREDEVEFPEGRVGRHPHFYGPLNLDSVFRVVDLPPEPDGSFRLPPDLP
jgi:uncharacterized protein (DUF952 family)